MAAVAGPVLGGLGAGLASGAMGKLFGGGGSDAGQVGLTSNWANEWLMQQAGPLIERMGYTGMMDQPLYSVGELPPTPTAQGYTAQGYTAPRMPFSSPMDYLQRGEMDTARNIMENFYGSGGGGSGRGGGSGAGFDREAALSSQLAQGALGRYTQAMLPWDQMAAQSSMFGAGAQNQAAQFGAGAQNQMAMMGYGGGLNRMNAINQSYAAPYALAGMFPGATPSPIVQPGRAPTDYTPYAMLGAYGARDWKPFGEFGNPFSGMGNLGASPAGTYGYGIGGGGYGF